MLETQFIKKLQQKPDHLKQVIMWAGVIFIMILIFALWLANFPFQNSSASDDAATTNLKTNLPSAFDGLKSQAGQLFNLFK